MHSQAGWALNTLVSAIQTRDILDLYILTFSEGLEVGMPLLES